MAKSQYDPKRRAMVKAPISAGAERFLNHMDAAARMGGGRTAGGYEERNPAKKQAQRSGEIVSDIRLPNESGKMDPRLKRKSTRKVGRTARRTAR